MPLIWMEVGLPPMWLMAHWPATLLIIVNQTPGGAAAAKSPPSCASISDDASQQTAVDTGTVWMDTVGVRRAGKAPPVTLWCVSRQSADPMVSALQMAVPVMLGGEDRTVAKSASQVSMETAAIRPAPALMAVPVTLSTDAVAVPSVSMATSVNKCVLWDSSACPALRSVTVTTCVHVTRRPEAVMPHCAKRPTTPYTELDTAWPNRCLHLGNKRKMLIESSLI